MTRRPEREMVPMVFDGEMIDDETVVPQGQSVPRLTFPRWRAVAGVAGGRVRAVVRCPAVVHARSVAGYRVRQAPRDAVRLVWFLVRGVGRWGAKGWRWGSHADLRADARAARLAGDVQARRTAQETIRADARARWAKAGTVVRRTVVGAAVTTVVLVLLALGEMVAGREVMPGWLRAVYAVRDAIGHGVAGGWPWVWRSTVCALVCAAVWEGRDRTPGASWITRPDRDDDGSWVDERMISKALAHLGIAPLNAFLRGGGELVYTVPARRDGDGTHARIRLPLGVTADMVCDRRRVLAANLGRSSLETWPTTGEEDGVLDLWVADKGTLSGGAGDWPLLHEGTVDVFDGVPVGLSQRGVVVAPPLPESNWLIGGRPGQGKTNLLRVLLLGAALDPTCELWVFVMGESPDFEPLRPRLSRYRMGLDDTVAAGAVRALEDLCSEMERRGRILGEQPGRPPKVSRRLADKPALGLHPLILAVDECHELFQHPTYGRKAEEFAVRLIKRGRKYGITLMLATQSPTKDSIPKEITRNISCGAAFAVADHIANDGLLGSGKYRAGIRATELRMRTDRGTCVAVGITDATFELVRTFYVPFEDGADLVSPVIARAMAHMTDAKRTVVTTGGTRKEIDTTPADHLKDIYSIIGEEPRVRTQVILARLAAHNPREYEPWSLRDLRATLRSYGIRAYKSDGTMVLRAADVAEAISRRDLASDD
ncbi:hypothetical protein GCM10022243_11370 [Saccharothrix violaceirubra]|uniref:S-DNA-T family DNA segregation ATPase FtsK/SpoIIIE n=1 Tax=Saccharothrix violaceirubra TaxID=413306 RepID=A0A7W7T8P2_9PSEU|nr:FtsK/SpoIIIE domain-containing protein [Saccharothrix violaceirubra]MBB4968638.1 S-DNA-T family DNA segregation ATPase FtsK/SpoIIIE [Saccharothrix violaceirubra]